MSDQFLTVVNGGIGALDSDVRNGASIRSFGRLVSFSDAEGRALDDLKGLIESYLESATPIRPLCIAIFGAPGSGKSFAAKQIALEINKRQAPRLRLAEAAVLNLTQVRDTDELAVTLDGCTSSPKEGEVPFVIFDEFDATKSGTKWGWLNWFLAPMQDASFRMSGLSITVRQAVFVFAGGTATNYAEFGKRDPGAFALAKGPDFSSRLRGTLDVQGVNEEPNRSLRRAVVLNGVLQEKANRFSEDLLEALREAGRYRHGARSIEAVVEMLLRKDGQVTLADVEPITQLLAMHVDLGPLDGLSIGFSGKRQGVEARYADTFDAIWRAAARAVWKDGGTIVYGGDARQGGLTEVLQKELSSLPRRLVDKPSTLSCQATILPRPPDSPIPSVSKGPPRSTVLLEWVYAQMSYRQEANLVNGTSYDRVSTIAPIQAEPDKHWENARALFRVRHRMTLMSDARFALGGHLQHESEKSNSFRGRFPGVAEEVMLAIAAGQPVYIVGSLGGAAYWVGALLGLGSEWHGEPPGFASDFLTVDSVRAQYFRPPPYTALPLSRDELVRFFLDHALCGPRWPPNGLSPRENRQLFEESSPERVVCWLLLGLSRLKRQPEPWVGLS